MIIMVLYKTTKFIMMSKNAFHLVFSLIIMKSYLDADLLTPPILVWDPIKTCECILIADCNLLSSPLNDVLSELWKFWKLCYEMGFLTPNKVFLFSLYFCSSSYFALFIVPAFLSGTAFRLGLFAELSIYVSPILTSLDPDACAFPKKFIIIISNKTNIINWN